MGHLTEQLKQYLATATLEQLEEDKKLLEEYNYGPTVGEYLESIGYDIKKKRS